MDKLVAQICMISSNIDDVLDFFANNLSDKASVLNVNLNPANGLEIAFEYNALHWPKDCSDKNEK